jgi:hypothetical protein
MCDTLILLFPSLTHKPQAGAVNKKPRILFFFWEGRGGSMMLCSFVGGDEYSGGMCCIYLHYRRVS